MAFRLNAGTSDSENTKGNEIDLAEAMGDCNIDYNEALSLPHGCKTIPIQMS